jgi:hypothetical protein
VFSISWNSLELYRLRCRVTFSSWWWRNPLTGLGNLWHMCPKWQVERFLWHTSLTAVPIFYLFMYFILFLLPNWHLYIVNNMCVYIYICVSDCADIVYELPFLPNNTASETFLYKSGGVWSVYWIFYHWCASLAVTGWISDIGWNVLHPSFQTGSSTSPSSCHIPYCIPQGVLY